MTDPNGSMSEREPPADGRLPRGDRVYLIDLLLTLSRGRGLIVLWVLGFGLAGVLYAALVSPEYTATAKVVR
ncbi:MAG: Wzz/FepE/Etk N-terminal domain-containing protein, partial [Salinibacter sp.]